MNNRSLSIVAVLLGLALVAALVWGFNRAGKVTEVESENAEVTEQLDQMTILRDNLTQEVESLTTSYEAAAADNEELQGNLSTTVAELDKARAALARANRSSSNDKAVAAEMRQQIEELIQVRSDLERSIEVIQTQNDSLRTRTAVLENQLTVSESEKEALASLNRNMQAEIDQLTLDNFKATAFQVELTRGSRDKLVTKGRRAKRLAVTFDLANVPAEYQGVRPLYLVVTDQSGTPVTAESTIPVKINAKGQSLDIMPIATRDFDVEDTQRINFVHELDDRLSAGFYRAQVYTDVGLLGASSFRLN